MDIDFTEYRLSGELRGHDDDVRGICVCGNVGIATSSRDKTIRVWSLDPVSNNRNDYATSKILLGHTSFVGPLAWVSPNEEFPEGGMDTLVLVWDLRTGEAVQTLKGHKSQVTGIALDGSDIVSASVDCTLRRWRKSQPIESWEAHKAAIQSVIKLPSGELVTGSSDTTLKLWRGRTCMHTFVGHTDTVRSLAVMPDLGIISASHDGSIRLWAISGQVLMEMVGHTSIVYSVDLHPSGLIVSGSEDCFAKIWKAGLAAATRRQHKRPNYAGSPRTLPNSDYSHQMLMLNKLQTRKKPLDKLKTTQAWRRVSGVIFFTAVAAVLICLVRAAAIVVPPVVVTSSVRLGPWVRGLVRFGRNIRLQ